MSYLGDIYQLDRLPFSSREFHSRFTNLVGPLSLFEAEERHDVGNKNPEVERPLTPIEQAVKAPPPSFTSFAKLVRPRLNVRDGVPGLSINEQQELIGVLMQELNNTWSDMKSVPPDPFLTSQENKELQRRLAIEVVVITQGLFAKYLDKANKLNERGVFSGPANVSRLRTQLALEANKCLNVLSIRRTLANEIKHPCDTSTVSSSFSFRRVIGSGRVKNYKPFTVRIEEQRKEKTYKTREEKHQRFMENEINDMQAQMPDIVQSHRLTILPPDLILRKKEEPAADEESIKSSDDVRLTGETKEPHYLREKCKSEPAMDIRETLLEELGLTVDEGEVLRRKYSVGHCLEDKELNNFKTAVRKMEPKPGTAEYNARDLQQLLAPSTIKAKEEEAEAQVDEDLPPLLQALAHHSSAASAKKKAKLRERLGREDGHDQEDNASDTASFVGSTVASSVAVDPTMPDEQETEFTGEEHPQPGTVLQRLPDKSVVRTSDVRVSNRVNKNSVTLDRYPTVYNDLIGEINPKTVKWLDRNLFIGEEIKEVYEEIMKTINKDHRLYGQDDYVEACAEDVNASVAMSSMTLTGSGHQRIINQSLHRKTEPPWGEFGADEWRNSPKFGGLGREDILGAKLGDGGATGGQKSYNSWLAWFRSTITYDDYLKSISKKDNDYLSLVFHLYDSEHETEGDGDDTDRPNSLEVALMREREKKMTELKTLKTDYTPGVWNANSIFLGGLGKDPEINEEELLANIELPSPPSSRSAVSAPARVGAVGAGSIQRSGSVSSRASSASRESSVLLKETPEYEKILAELQASRAAKTVTAASATTKTSEAASLSCQDRLERIWTLLCMPDPLRLDMAVKYSADPYCNKLDQAIRCWETAAELILERESLITKLEDFERTASDPNRFFERGPGGSSMARIRETRIRSSFNKKLDELNLAVKKAVKQVSRNFGDTVTFQGRPYLDKMTADRTEMLYWLQQERRQQALDREMIRTKHIVLNVPELNPLNVEALL